MSKNPENPSAFPWNGQGVFIPEKGMTLRDYFAAAALQGVLARPNTPAERDMKSVVALHCYDYADAMLKAREASHD